MNFRFSRRAMTRFLLYGIYSEPFSRRYGDGWFAVLLGAAARTFPFAFGVAALNCIVAPGVLTVGRLAFMTALFFGYNLLMERHLICRSRREAK
ncbi:protein of unknown function [Burkholderia multivorans]